MRFPTFIIISLFFLLPGSILPCGCWLNHSGNVLLYRIMPLDETDYYQYLSLWSSDRDLHRKVDYKAENLKLWRQQTASWIRLDDIENIVYHADIGFLQSLREQSNPSAMKDNSFVQWIVQHQRTDILDFLILAKQTEEVRLSMNDPWYYDVKGSYHYRMLGDVVERCRHYTSGPLLGRYALQMMRALCSLREYQNCADYWDDIKDRLPNNAIRKMAELRAASALCKVGRCDEAFDIYARYGDVASIRAVKGGQIDNELAFVYDRAPNSPYLAGEVQKWLNYFGNDETEERIKNGISYSYDDKKLQKLLEVAQQAVKEKKSRQLAMWYYVLAAIHDTKGDPHTAKKYLQLGQRYRKDQYLADTYRVLRMWLDAKTSTYYEAYEERLLNDLQWLAGKIRREATPEVHKRLIMDAWGEKYADYNLEVYQCVSNTFYWNDALRRILFKAVCPRMHEAGKYVREIQLANLAENLLLKSKGYAGEMFVIIDRLPYSVTRTYYARIFQPEDDFDRFVNSRGRTDRNYWYDILATKCLRERRYSQALVYLRRLPVSFQQTLNVYPHMQKNPFCYDMEVFKNDKSLAPDYKLHFAESMVNYERTMKLARDPNVRADAMVQYALGLRNSVHRCWFLTRHSSNINYNYIMYPTPEIPYPEDSTIYRHKEYVEMSEKLIDEAILTYTDREKAARQLHRLLHYRRIANSFADTQTAREMRSRCDKWKDYVDPS